MNNPFNIGDRVHIMYPSELGLDITPREYAGLGGTILGNYPEDGNGTYTGAYIVQIDGAGSSRTLIESSMLRYPNEAPWEAMHRKGMDPEFIRNQIVIISQHADYRGRLGVVQKIIPKNFGVYEYEIRLIDPELGIIIEDGFIKVILEKAGHDIIMPPYSILMYSIDGINPVCKGDAIQKIESSEQKSIPLGFDLSRYLDKKTMSTMATNIFEEKFSAFVDEIIKNRSFDSSAPEDTDVISYLVGITIDKIAKELAEKYEGKIIEIIGYELEREEPYKDDGHYDIFKVQLGCTLGSVANTYISNHMDEINELLKGPIKKGIEEITSKNFQQTVIKKLTDSYHTILADALIDRLEGDSNPVT